MTTININLLGIEQKERNRFRGGLPIDRGWLISVACVAVSLFIAVGGTVYFNWMVASAEEQKTGLEEDIKKLEGQLGQIKDIQSKKAVALAEQRILEYVTGKTYSWSKFLNELRDITPDSLWIENVAVSGDNVTLSGNTFDHQTVAFFLANLQASSLFDGVTLTNSTKSVGKEGLAGVHFTLTAKLKFDVTPPPGSDSAAAAAPANGSDGKAENKTMGNDAAANAARGKEALHGGAGKAAMQVGG